MKERCQPPMKKSQQASHRKFNRRMKQLIETGLPA